MSGPVAFVPMKLAPYLQVDDIAFSIRPADFGHVHEVSAGGRRRRQPHRG
ncbi:MAG: hypothetical protein JSW36_16530 [Burkholderiales bacterium]|nr:MAG: hypothetical protein JSW36_16530 [Burkholderiales bacterium]